MTKRVLYLLILLAMVLGLTLAACGGGAAQNTEEPAAEEPATEAPVAEEPATEEPAAEEPTAEPMMDLSGTTVTFWHVYGEGDPLNPVVISLVEEFNATNEYGITVEAFDQGEYSDIEDKVNAGLTSGDLPNIAQAYTSAFLNWDTVDAVADINPYMMDATYGLTQEEYDAIYPSVLEAGVTQDGRRLTWPLTQSANALVYNYTWAQELGFDSPPSTSGELKEQLCAAAEANATDDNPDNDGTGGMVWYPAAENLLSIVWAFGGSEFNEAGDAYDFTSQPWVDAALFVSDLKTNGCTFETESYPNPEQANRLALVTSSSTSGLRFYGYAFADAENDDEWGFLPFLGPDGNQAVDAYKQTVGVMKSTPEQELASWIFIKYLTTPENQAAWIKASGYLPTQTTTESLLTDYIDSVPQYASTIELAAIGPGEPETFPAWNSVRRGLDEAAALLYVPNLTADDAMAILEQLTADAADYVAEIE